MPNVIGSTLVLAGPVLRRSSDLGVHVWFATSRPVQVTARLRRFRETPKPGRKYKAGQLAAGALAQGTGTSYQLGTKLFVHLVELAPPNPAKLFPTAEVLCYEVDFEEQDGTRHDLASLGLLDQVTLRGLPLPSLVLQGATRSLRALYGSCRKLHGKGPDAALGFLHLLEPKATHARARPQHLVLGGDQVYADDVSDSMFAHIVALGHELFGADEEVPGLGKLSKIGLRSRGDAITEHGKFSSTHGHNHVLGFGEFAALYLLAWNPGLWPSKYPHQVRQYEDLERRSAADGSYIELLSRSAEERKELEDARRGCAALRKVLANIPTYMIYDDHEVTDDWNLSPTWTEDVHKTSAGRRVVANGLAAFVAFQAWGNDPASIGRQKVFAAMEVRGKAPADAAAGATLERSALALRGLHAVTASTPGIVLMDTRTSRGRAGARMDYIDGVAAVRPPFPRALSRGSFAPRLLDDRARAAILAHAKLAAQHADTLILLAPGPIIGAELIEAIQSAASRVAGPATADLESWIANPRGFLDALEIVAKMRRRTSIVLSGDVHYAFAAKATLVSTMSGAQQLLQFTSSATKNISLPETLAHRWISGVAPKQTTDWWKDTPSTHVTVRRTEKLKDEELATHNRVTGGRPPDFTLEVTFQNHRQHKDQQLLELNNVGYLELWSHRGGRNRFLTLDRKGAVRTIGEATWS